MRQFSVSFFIQQFNVPHLFQQVQQLTFALVSIWLIWSEVQQNGATSMRLPVGVFGSSGFLTGTRQVAYYSLFCYVCLKSQQVVQQLYLKLL
jgi:hypothetical protein